MSASAASPWQTAEERERERVLKREAVLAAAVRSFNERGFRATSLEEIALSLGISKPTIYHYFSGKDEILFECARRGLDSIRKAAEEAGSSGRNGRERLAALMRDYALVMTRDFGMCVIRTPDHELAPSSRRKLRDLKREIDLTVRKVVESGMTDGSLAARDAQMATFAITGGLNWIARWYDPAGGRPAEEIADDIVGVLLSGVLPREQEGTKTGG